jgi:hypothetical protein
MKWESPKQQERMAEISRKLGRLLTEQTEFFRKGARMGNTPQEFRRYEESRERVRELFAELERLRKAA